MTEIVIPFLAILPPFLGFSSFLEGIDHLDQLGGNFWNEVFLVKNFSDVVLDFEKGTAFSAKHKICSGETGSLTS